MALLAQVQETGRRRNLLNGWNLSGPSIIHTGCVNAHGHTAIIKLLLTPDVDLFTLRVALLKLWAIKAQ